MIRVNLSPRRKNSGRQHEGKRFPSHLSWLRKRPCLVEGRAGHVCDGKIEAAHGPSDGNRAMSCKVDDRGAVPLCSLAHHQQHQWGIGTWQRHYGVNMADAAKQYAAASPHRIQWSESHGA